MLPLKFIFDSLEKKYKKIYLKTDICSLMFNF